MTALERMKAIVADIDDELQGAEHYARVAIKCKGHDNAAAATYLSMAKQELTHVDNLTDMAQRTISGARDAQDANLAGLEAIWELESDRMADWIVKIKLVMDKM